MNTIRNMAASVLHCFLPTENRNEITESPSTNETPPIRRQPSLYYMRGHLRQLNLGSPAADVAPTISKAVPTADDNTHHDTQSSSCVPSDERHVEDSSGVLLNGGSAGDNQSQENLNKGVPVLPSRRGSTASMMEGFLRTAQRRAAKHISPHPDTEISLANQRPYTPLGLKELEELLTAKEIEALTDYIQHGGGLSHAMRNKEPMTEKQEEMLAHIQRALAKIRERGGSYPGLLHRGMKAGVGERDNSNVELFKEGKKFEELGLMSTSSESAFVNSWHDGIKLTVAAPTNGDIIALNPLQMEALCEPAKYDVLLAAFDGKGVFRALISDEDAPPDRGRAKRYQSSYEGHLIRPAHELHAETDFLAGEIPSDSESQRRYLIMNLTLALNSILKPESFRPMVRRILRSGTFGVPNPYLTGLNTVFSTPITEKTPVEVAAVLAPLFGTQKMKQLLASLDAELRHLKDGAASRKPEQS